MPGEQNEFHESRDRWTLARTSGRGAGRRLALWSLTLALIAGCQSMTRRQEARQALKEEQVRRAEQLKREQEVQAKAEEERAAEILKENERLVERDKLRYWRATASELVYGTEPQKGLDLLDEILRELGVKKVEKPRTEGEETAGEDKQRFEKPIFDDADMAKVYALQGTALFKLERKDEAVASMRRALELDPDATTVRRNLGKILLMAEKYEEALEVYRPEMEKGVRDADLLFPVAQALFLGAQADKSKEDPSKVEAARVALQLVLVERPSDPEVRRWLALLEFETERYEEAARLFEAMRKERPLEPEYLEYLANCYVKLAKYEKAADLLELAARVRPPGAEASRTLGDLYQMLGLSSRAAEWLIRSSGGTPEGATAEDRWAIGSLLLEAGKLDDAARWLEALAEQDKQYVDAQSSLAWAYQDLGREDEALRAFEKVQRVKPQDGAMFLAAADIYLGRKKYDIAEDAYARASGLADTRAEGYAGLAEVAYARGNLDEAARMYKRAVELDPRSNRYAVLLKQIQEEQHDRGQAEAVGAAGGAARG